MNQDRLNSELEELEKELSAMRPAAVPEPLLNRLRELPPKFADNTVRRESLGFLDWLRDALRPLAAAAAALLLVAACAGWWWQARQVAPVGRTVVSAPVDPVLTAKEVDIEETLVASFETVARLPDGQSVRFRYEEWVDEFRVRDAMRGMVLEKREPRVEIIPIRYETY